MRRPPQTELARRSLGPFFIAAGALHFVKPRPYEAIVPPWVPRPREAVIASGMAEMVGGAAALSERMPSFTRWWLTGLLVAVFPANVQMATSPDRIEGMRVPRWLLWARLPVQGLLVAWVWRSTR